MNPIRSRRYSLPLFVPGVLVMGISKNLSRRLVGHGCPAAQSRKRLMWRERVAGLPRSASSKNPMDGVFRGSLILLAACLLLASPVSAERHKPDNAYALQGLEVGRLFWDISASDPARLAGRFSVILETYQDFRRQGREVEMVLAFRGGAVRFVSTNPDHHSFEEAQQLEIIQSRLRALLDMPGVRAEACEIAMRRVPMDGKDLMKGVHHVGNTFVSIAGYSHRGFVVIPVP